MTWPRYANRIPIFDEPLVLELVMLPLLLSIASHAAPPPPLTSEMHARFNALTSARDAVIAGKLKDASAAIAPLCSTDPLAPFPATWAPMLRRVEDEAKILKASPDLASASVAVAKVAIACAECHIATGGGPLEATATDIPPQKWDEGQNMPLHRWAANWMWLGLIANDSGAWERGATELDTQPLAMMFENAPIPGMKELEQRVYQLANKAVTTEDLSERGVLYGELLSTCNQCHVKRPVAKGKP